MMLLKPSKTIARELVLSCQVWEHGKKSSYTFKDDDPIVPTGKIAVVTVEIKDKESAEMDANPT